MQQLLFKLLFLFGLLLFLVAGIGISDAVSADRETVPLHDNLGKHQYPVSTVVPLAQQYFDQGLILSFGFNHAEAARSFREAARLDPKCAMCYWGEALVLGPNINAPMNDADVPRAYSAAQKALSLVSNATKKENALIQALTKRYTSAIAQDRSHLDEAYAQAMRVVFRQYPDDVLIGSLLAEALMDLHPWDYWKKNGEAQPWTSEIVSTLEAVLTKEPNQPLANHLYIHAIEGSPHPEKALPSAERLATLVPGSGHLVHMPAHIYLRIGRYHDAALANQEAVKVDQHYLNHSHVESIYTAAYVPHNFHFLWAAATKTGQYKLAMEAARDTAAKVNPEEMREPGFSGTLQHFWLMPLYTQALFGKWHEILKESEPPADLLYIRGIWHYARGLAQLRQGEIDSAQLEVTHLRQIIADPAVTDLKIFDVNEITQVLKIAQAVLEGEILAEQQDYEAAIVRLERAVSLEDGLNYTEPKDWYLPPRQVLGAVLLTAGKAAEAEQVYREDLQFHPQNGWSLYGLVQALRAQGKKADAETTQEQFSAAWSDADVVLTSSRF
jgi:tetratricopeptide (TPR) repeat protein